MNPLLATFTWRGYQFGVLKLSLFALGVLVGAYFPDFWKPYFGVLWVTFIVTSLATAVWGLQSLRKAG
jgi:hypothetical protein